QPGRLCYMRCRTITGNLYDTARASCDRTAWEGHPPSERLRKVVAFLGQILEARVVLQPGKLDVSSRAVALFGDDDVGLAGNSGFFFVVRAVVFVAMDEPHHVGVLFDGAAFSQVAEAGPIVLRRLGLTVQLSQADNRHF